MTSVVVWMAQASMQQSLATSRCGRNVPDTTNHEVHDNSQRQRMQRDVTSLACVKLDLPRTFSYHGVHAYHALHQRESAGFAYMGAVSKLQVD